MRARETRDGEPTRFPSSAKKRGFASGDRAFAYSEIVSRGRTLDLSERLDELEAGAQEDDVVTISYTSGTTGNPTGIMLTNRNYYVNCKDAVEFFEVPFDYQTLIILPCDHSFAHTVGTYASLFRGISLYFVGGGALLERSQQEFYRALGVPIYQGYGLTEAAPVISSNCPGATR